MKRFAAPVAFLAAVTIAVLLVRSALHQGGRHTAPPATTTTRTTTRSHRKKHVHHRSVRTYTVQSGDTFASIAQKNGTTVARLEQLNPGIDPTALQVGQTIRVK
ncbi:MAG TPA: LysM domain-containing protein [Gaiellaceae bacterium]|nr:LysM domain-containing protein [Gaiellaceae bacterium]